MPISGDDCRFHRKPVNFESTDMMYPTRSETFSKNMNSESLANAILPVGFASRASSDVTVSVSAFSRQMR